MAYYHIVRGNSESPGVSRLRRAAGTCSIIVVSLWLFGGCRSSSVAGRARLAEREGRHHEAYQLYCEEARQQPSSSAVRKDISRVAPKAARYWQTEADRASARGQYADAWKMYMQALEITPDNDALVSLVRNFEAQHPEALSSAREEWMAGEGEPLASATPREAPHNSAVDPPPAPAAAEPPPPPAREMATPVEVPEAVVPSEVSDPPELPPADETKNEGPSNQPPPSTGEDQAESPPDARYIYTGILSMGDRRFPKRSPPIDGLRVKLLDTDPEGDADFEVSLDDLKAKKAKNVTVGRGVVVRGRSGKWYEVVLLTVVDSTESVRIGVRPYNR